jgi:hypothetical protein
VSSSLGLTLDLVSSSLGLVGNVRHLLCSLVSQLFTTEARKRVSALVHAATCAEREGDNVLPVVEVSVSLSDLCAEVDEMATEEEVVYGSDGESVAHEGSRVTTESESHRS